MQKHTEDYTLSMTEILAMKFPQRDWGGWHRRGRTLCYPVRYSGEEQSNRTYDLDLLRFTSSAQVLNMIIQVGQKTWATNACLAGLVRALDDILCPQGTLCSSGMDHRLTTKQIRDIIKETKRCR
jgi:hypothetical protein